MQSETNVTILMSPERKKGVADALKQTLEDLNQELILVLTVCLVSAIFCMFYFRGNSYFEIFFVSLIGFFASFFGGSGFLFLANFGKMILERDRFSCEEII